MNQSVRERKQSRIYAMRILNNWVSWQLHLSCSCGENQLDAAHHKHNPVPSFAGEDSPNSCAREAGRLRSGENVLAVERGKAALHRPTDSSSRRWSARLQLPECWHAPHHVAAYRPCWSII